MHRVLYFLPIANELVLASLTVNCMFCSSYLNVFLEMGGKWPYSCCFPGSCFQDLFNIAPCIFVQFQSCVFSMRFVSVHLLHPYSCNHITTRLKTFQSIAAQVFTQRILTSLSVDEKLLPSYLNLSTDFKGLPFRAEMVHSRLKHMYSILSAFTWKPMPPATRFRLLC